MHERCLRRYSRDARIQQPECITVQNSIRHDSIMCVMHLINQQGKVYKFTSHAEILKSSCKIEESATVRRTQGESHAMQRTRALDTQRGRQWISDVRLSSVFIGVVVGIRSACSNSRWHLRAAAVQSDDIG